MGKIYGALSERHSGGLPLTIAALSALLTAEEMNHLSALLQKPESLSRAEEALKDYIRIIQDACLRRSGTQETDPLLAAQEKNRKKKGYGGKQV